MNISTRAASTDLPDVRRRDPKLTSDCLSLAGRASDSQHVDPTKFARVMSLVMLAMRDQLQVSWINAGSDMTHMVQIHPVGDWAVVTLPNDTMSEAPVSDPIASYVQGSVPEPTARCVWDPERFTVASDAMAWEETLRLPWYSPILVDANGVDASIAPTPAFAESHGYLSVPACSSE